MGGLETTLSVLKAGPMMKNGRQRYKNRLCTFFCQRQLRESVFMIIGPQRREMMVVTAITMTIATMRTVNKYGGPIIYWELDCFSFNAHKNFRK